MMVYDLTGPWAPDNAGPHSPFSFAESSLFYWKQQGMDETRLTMGLPFYGYDFEDPTSTSAYTYRYIVSMNEENAQVDQVDEIYYNGIPTIKAKTEYALDENLVGVMIWELGQDNYEELSLLDAIDEVINGLPSAIEEGEFSVKVYPNPASRYINIETSKPSRLRIVDLQGKIYKEINDKSHNHIVDCSGYNEGIYAVEIRTSISNEFRLISIVK